MRGLSWCWEMFPHWCWVQLTLGAILAQNSITLCFEMQCARPYLLSIQTAASDCRDRPDSCCGASSFISLYSTTMVCGWSGFGKPDLHSCVPRRVQRQYAAEQRVWCQQVVNKLLWSASNFSTSCYELMQTCGSVTRSGEASMLLLSGSIMEMATSDVVSNIWTSISALCKQARQRTCGLPWWCHSNTNCYQSVNKNALKN